MVAAATLLAGGILTVPHAMALETDGQYYSSKQPYVAPSEATTASYSQAPEGYETVYTESMARHGSRGLSSYKYDALLMKMAEAAEADNGFKSDAIKIRIHEESQSHHRRKCGEWLRYAHRSGC
mgnify:CR=1 FL=1